MYSSICADAQLRGSIQVGMERAGNGKLTSCFLESESTIVLCLNFVGSSRCEVTRLDI